MAKVVEASDPHVAWTTMTWRQGMTLFLSGVLVGLVTYGLYVLLERYVFEPIMCRETVALVRCESKDEFANVIALVLGSMLGIVLMVRQRVYRPLLAILGIFLAFWSIFLTLAALPWIVMMIVAALTFGFAYLLFGWLVQPISLPVSLVMVTLAVVAIRVVLTV